MKKPALISIILLVSITIAAYAQPDTLWTQTLGGSSHDRGYSIQQTTDGGYIIAGSTSSYGAGGTDVYLIKTDGDGNESWYQTFGGSGSEWGNCVQQTTDGGYIIAVYTFSYGADSTDVYLIKTDGNGNETWTRTFGESYSDNGYCVQQTTDGGYIIVGYTYADSADVYLIKTDGNGNESWTQTYGGSSDDFGYCVQQTTDGGYIISGYTSSYGAGGFDVYLIKTDGNGNESWSQTFGGSDIDGGNIVQQTTDGGYIIEGNTSSYGAGGNDVYLIKTDANGNESWSQTFGGSDDDYGKSVQQTTDGGYIIGGYTSSYGAGGWDVYSVKTDANGNESWSQTFGGSSNDRGQSVQQTTDGGCIIVGGTSSYGAGNTDVYLIRLEAEYPSPEIGLSADSLLFPETVIGFTTELPITIYNIGTADLSVDSMFFEQYPDVFSVGWIPGDDIISRGDSLEITVYFTPVDAIEYVDILNICNNDELAVVVVLGNPYAPILWTQTFGGGSDDYSECVQQTMDGGYIIAGTTSSYGTGYDSDVYLIKTDGIGNESWYQTFGGSDSEWGQSVQQTTDGGYIIAGHTESYGAGGYDVYLIKTDENGNELWSQTFGGVGWDDGYSVQQTTDGGYIVAGTTSSYGTGNDDFYLIKTDGNGNEAWSQTFGGTGADWGHGVQQTTDGGYILAGYTGSYGAGGGDFYLIKTDGDGNETWSRTFGGTGPEYGYSVQQTTDGGYIIAGRTGSYGALGTDVYLIKTDNNGIEVWSQTFGGSGWDCGYSVQQTSDGGYIIAGQTSSYGAGNEDFYLIKTDADGDSIWTKTFGGSSDDVGKSVQQTTDGGYIIAGYTDSFGVSESDVYLICLEGELGVEEHFGSPHPSEFILYPAYPNPFNPSTTLSFSLPTAGEVALNVYNIQGREVAKLIDGFQPAGSHQVTFDAKNLTSGVYFVRLEAGDFSQTEKLLLIK